jgi:hypothetical protein
VQLVCLDLAGPAIYIEPAIHEYILALFLSH